MPDTVDDFMARFGGEKSIDDREAAHYHDRFVSSDPKDSGFDNRTYHEAATEYLGKLPDEEFTNAARNAVSNAPAQERQGLLNTLLGALGGGAGAGGAAAGLSGLARTLGLSSSDPSQMNEDDAARVVNYARKERPEALRQVVEEKPWFVKALGHPIVLGALTMAAAKLLGSRTKNS